MSKVRLARIDLFPLKSFDAMTVEQAAVLPSGALRHDRQFVLCDSAGKWVNGKRTPRVHEFDVTFPANWQSEPTWPICARHRPTGQSVCLTLRDQRAELCEFFAQILGFPVTLQECADSGFPDDVESPGPTVISEESLAEVGQWFGFSVEESRRRFRANLLLQCGEPFWEDRLFSLVSRPVGFRIGSVLLFGMNPCARCVVPTRDSYRGQQQPAFARQFATLRREHLPPHATRAAFDHYFRLAVNTRLYALAGGELRVGDEVDLVAT